VVIDYRETAPAACKADSFVHERQMTGHKVVGVPGTVRGLGMAHQRFGSLPWRAVVRPAVELAEKGFELDEYSAKSLNDVLASAGEFSELQRVYARPDREAWSKSNRLVQPDLARTLRVIADSGPDAFYDGPIADQIVAEMQDGKGWITKEDLRAYRAVPRPALRTTYRGNTVLCPPAPGGGVCLVELLNIVEPLQLRADGRYSAKTLHRLTEAMRYAYCDRARHLGDPAFTEIPRTLTNKAYAATLSRKIAADRATPSESLAPDVRISDEPEHTTHFSVIDRDGMAVANTYTLQDPYGSRVVVRGGGFLLNNEMDDFNWRPGRTDRQGRIGTTPNQIAPGKRMLSSQTPTMVLRDGRVMLVTGSPGGRTIINTVAQVVLNVLEFEMDPVAAVAAPRIHHQWLPDLLRCEPELLEQGETMRALQGMGHVLDSKRELQGDAHTIYVNPITGTYLGIADGRRSGAAAGY
jgi:gamma-glutamyltranspeptidase/glutathione hydrolase